MSLHHTRSLLTKVSRWQCSGAPTCLHCEATRALEEVEAVVDALADWQHAEESSAWINDASLGTLRRIAEETRTRNEVTP